MAVQIEQTSAPVKRHLISLEEYDRMIEAGVFEPDTNVELIRGEIVDMLPREFAEESAVAILYYRLFEQTSGKAIIWPPLNSLGLPESNPRPQPDMALLRWRDDLYRGKRPAAEDVMVVVEVSDTSLKFERGMKKSIYAQAGITEYWIVNLRDKLVEVNTKPVEGKYTHEHKYKRGEVLPLPGGIEGTIRVDEIIG